MPTGIFVSALRAQQASEAHGAIITIARGARSCVLVAACSRRPGELTGEDGSLTQFVFHDWLVVVSDCVFVAAGLLPALAFTPQRGDTLTTSTGGVFSIAHPDGKSKAVDWHDPQGTTLRIHSVEG